MSRRAWVLIGGAVGLWLVLLVLIGVIGIVAVAGSGGAAEWEEHRVLGTGAEKVAMVNIRGGIHDGESGGGVLGGQSAGARTVTSQLRQAEEDEDVAAVVLRLETPGGSVVASDDIYRAVQRVGERKPVVASMGGMAASGGYYIAAGAERIVANPATLTASIGVIMVIPNLEETAEKLGVRPVVLTAGEFKDEGSPFREMRPEEREHFQRLLDEAHEQFIEVVAEGRDLDPGEVREAATGRVHTGLQAMDMGLVDEFGDLEEGYRQALDLADLTEEDARLVEYQAPRRLADLFSPFARSSPVEEAKRELGLEFGLKYLYLP